MSTRTTSLQIVVMGVSGTGKSSVAARLADRLGADLVEGDEHHPQANIDKMAAGVPLDDHDRRPWLAELSRILSEQAAAGRATVMTCSALKGGYRDVLRSGVPGGVLFVHLTADRAVLAERMRDREGHFMPPSLLTSQLATLEPLSAREWGVAVDVSASLDVVVAAAAQAVADRTAVQSGEGTVV